VAVKNTSPHAGFIGFGAAVRAVGLDEVEVEGAGEGDLEGVPE